MTFDLSLALRGSQYYTPERLEYVVFQVMESETIW